MKHLRAARLKFFDAQKSAKQRAIKNFLKAQKRLVQNALSEDSFTAKGGLLLRQPSFIEMTLG